MNYRDFTSLPPDKEQQFIVFEKTSVESLAQAKRMGAIVAAIFGVLVLIVVMSFEKPKNKMADDDMGMLKRSSKSKKAEKPDKPAVEDKQETPAKDEATKDEATKDEATKDEATTGEDEEGAAKEDTEKAAQGDSKDSE